MEQGIYPKVQKCTMCADRVLGGQADGLRGSLPHRGHQVRRARASCWPKRRQRLRDNPGKYVDHIYGEHEVGGTSVLLLSSVPFEEFGYRTDLPD